MALLVFVSYAPQDEDLWTELDAHLSTLRRQGIISSWHAGRIGPGMARHHETAAALSSADLILLLVSANFMAADQCYEQELEHAMRRHHEGSARVIPILLRPTDLGGVPLSSLQVLPRDGAALTELNNRDRAWADIVAFIRRTISELQQKRRTPHIYKYESDPRPNDQVLTQEGISLVPTTRSQVRPQPPGAPYQPEWYIHRPRAERDALGYLASSGKPIIIWGPEGFGKTWLTEYLAENFSRQNPERSHVVQINLQSLSERHRSSDDTLLLELALLEHLTIPTKQTVQQ